MGVEREVRELGRYRVRLTHRKRGFMTYKESKIKLIPLALLDNEISTQHQKQISSQL